VWRVLCGADEARKAWPPDYYKTLISQLEKCAFTFPGSGQIEKDLERTMPELPLFRSHVGIDPLRRILCAYALRNPDSVGYCQSMNQLAGALLHVVLCERLGVESDESQSGSAAPTSEEEELAFWMLVHGRGA